MKVLFITSWYPNSNNSLKGIFVKKHAHAVLQAGADVQVLALSINYSTRIFEKKMQCFRDEKGLETHLIEINSRFYKFIHLHIWYQYAVLRRYYVKNIRPRFRPQVINSVVLYPAGILGRWISKKEKCPHVIIEHWSKVDRFMKRSLFSRLGKKAYASAKKIVVVSQFTKKILDKYVHDQNKIRVIPNVISTGLFYEAERQSPRASLVFACAAHWTIPKRPDLLFHSLQNLALKQKQIVLHVIGEGPRLDELKALPWDFDTRYHGNVPAEQVAAIFRQADYFLHASDIETFSVVIAEALSTGLPVLASNVGAIPELITNSNGLVCENTTAAWTAGLLSLLNKTDYDAHKIAAQAKSRFNEQRIGEAFIRLYNEL